MSITVVSSDSDRRALKIALFITASMAIVELVGGILANSLSLISDAWHMLIDVIAIGVSLAAIIIASKPPNRKRTYGHYRFEILASFVNGGTLVFIAGYIFYEAYRRFINPPDVNVIIMLPVAFVGLITNIAGIYFLRGGMRRSLNVRSAFLHMLGDTLSSIGVITAGLVIYLTGWIVVDTIVSILIGGIIMKGAIDLVIESSNILLESVPKEIPLEKVNEAIHEVKGVREVHDLHLWSITSGISALSAHVLIEDQRVSEGTRIINEVNNILKEKFNISHATLQLECNECSSVCRIASGSKIS